MITLRRGLPLFALLFIFAEPALAQGGTPFESILQYVVTVLTGGMARLVAIIAVLALGYMAFAGYLTWLWALRVILGIVLVFGAATIADLLIGSVG